MCDHFYIYYTTGFSSILSFEPLFEIASFFSVHLRVIPLDLDLKASLKNVSHIIGFFYLNNIEIREV